MNEKVILDPDKLLKKVKSISNRAGGKWWIGKVDDALKCIEQGENLLESFSGALSKEMKQLQCELLSQKALYSSFSGNIHGSLELANNSLKIAEEIDDKESISRALYAFGGYYYTLGDLEQSLEYFDHIIELRQDLTDNIANIIYLADSLWAATRVAVDKGDLERAKEYFKRVEELNEQYKGQNSVVYTFYLVAKALILKSSPRFRDKGMAEELYKKIVENKQIAANLRFMSLVDLCELLLNELRMTNDKTIVNEIKYFITKLMNIAQNTNLYYYLIESYVLQGKIALITFEIKEARRYLIQAQRMAEIHGYDKTALEIANLHEEMMQQLEMWDYLKEIDAPISKRMELARLSGDINEIIRARMTSTAQVSEKKVTVYKEQKKCLVCLGEIKGFNNYICPKCDSTYCEQCARALIEIENACWTCESPIDLARPVKFLKQEGEKVEKKEKKSKK